MVFTKSGSNVGKKIVLSILAVSLLPLYRPPLTWNARIQSPPYLVKGLLGNTIFLILKTLIKNNSVLLWLEA